MSLPAPPDTSADAPWKQRFRAPSVFWARVAPGDPTRGIVCWNRDGPFQIYAWDLTNDALRQLTFRPEGHAAASLSADGRWLLYLRDEGGTEIGHHVRVPWEGGEPVDLAPGLPPYASETQAGSADGRVFVAMVGVDDEFRLVRSALDAEDPSPRVVWTTDDLSFQAVPVADGSVAVAAVASHSVGPRFDLVAIDLEGGDVVAELWDGEGTGIDFGVVSPVVGDRRVAASSDRTGVARPFVWDPTSGERRDLPLPDVEGEVHAYAWSRDGRRLALKETWRAEDHLWIFDLEEERATRLAHPPGTYEAFGFAPDGAIWACRESSTEPGHVLLLDEKGVETRTAIVAGETPTSAAWRSVSFPAADGDELQAWVAVPDRDPPFPTVIETHGGPQGAMQDLFYPPAQVWTDHGYAYLTLNYRGSTGFGRDFMEKIWGNPGDLEVDDLVSARDWLIAEGITDPSAVLLTGWSYGGYLTLQGLGRRPDLWAGGMAGIAVADWRLMHEDSNDVLRGYLEGILGGGPDDVPDVYRKASPITYVEDLAAPVLVVQGRNDTRCPARQMEAYEAKAKAAGKDIEVSWFDSGHEGWTDVEVSIGFSEGMLEFADRILRDRRG